jgi:hypothetical protein
MVWTPLVIEERIAMSVGHVALATPRPVTMRVIDREGGRPAPKGATATPKGGDRVGVAGIGQPDVPCPFPFVWRIKRVQDGDLLVRRKVLYRREHASDLLLSAPPGSMRSGNSSGRRRNSSSRRLQSAAGLSFVLSLVARKATCHRPPLLEADALQTRIVAEAAIGQGTFALEFRA